MASKKKYESLLKKWKKAYPDGPGRGVHVSRLDKMLAISIHEMGKDLGKRRSELAKDLIVGMDSVRIWQNQIASGTFVWTSKYGPEIELSFDNPSITTYKKCISNWRAKYTTKYCRGGSNSENKKARMDAVRISDIGNTIGIAGKYTAKSLGISDNVLIFWRMNSTRSIKVPKHIAPNDRRITLTIGKAKVEGLSLNQAVMMISRMCEG